MKDIISPERVIEINRLHHAVVVTPATEELRKCHAAIGELERELDVLFGLLSEAVDAGVGDDIVWDKIRAALKAAGRN